MASDVGENNAKYTGDDKQLKAAVAMIRLQTKFAERYMNKEYKKRHI